MKRGNTSDEVPQEERCYLMSGKEAEVGGDRRKVKGSATF
jgi:hypothetical protein